MTPDYAPSLLRSFERHLRAENRSDNTVESYLFRGRVGDHVGSPVLLIESPHLSTW